MIFDFGEFTRVTEGVYKRLGAEDIGGLYDLDEALSVFYAYFSAFERYMGKPHPPIRAEQIERIIENMPYFDMKVTFDQFADDQIVELLPEDYPALIDKHFATRYRHCDYNINHFFSGRIREMKWYEENI